MLLQGFSFKPVHILSWKARMGDFRLKAPTCSAKDKV